MTISQRGNRKDHKKQDEMEKKMNRWIRRRIPRADEQHLSHGNLFILPSQFGLLYLLACALLFVIGTNYENNPILIICYLLLALFILSMYTCFLNLNGTQIAVATLAPCHLGDEVQMSLRIKRNTLAFGWNWQIAATDSYHTARIETDDKLLLSFRAHSRGYLYPPPVKLSTRFPLGLFVCWTYLRPARRHWVYPKIQRGDWQHIDMAKLDVDSKLIDPKSQTHLPQPDNFEGIKPYRQGYPMSLVSWKHQAKQPDSSLLLKAFSGDAHRPGWLSLDSVFSGSLEQKLAVLTHAVLNLERSNQAYGLTLSGYGGNTVLLPPDLGSDHLRQCLQALSLFGQSEPDDESESALQ